jgi:hypothetical protein
MASARWRQWPGSLMNDARKPRLALECLPQRSQRCSSSQVEWTPPERPLPDGSMEPDRVERRFLWASRGGAGGVAMSTPAQCRQNAAGCGEPAINTKNPAQAELDGIRAAFSNALKKLDVTDLTDPLAELVGRKIIRAALTGERDPNILCDVAIDGQTTGGKSKGG